MLSVFSYNLYNCIVCVKLKRTPRGNAPKRRENLGVNGDINVAISCYHDRPAKGALVTWYIFVM